MRAALALAVLNMAAAVTGRPVLPRGFMRLLDTRGREVGVPCLADEHMPAIGVFHLDVFGDGRLAFVAHPDTWAELGAEHLAAYYRKHDTDDVERFLAAALRGRP